MAHIVKKENKAKRWDDRLTPKQLDARRRRAREWQREKRKDDNWVQELRKTLHT